MSDGPLGRRDAAPLQRSQLDPGSQTARRTSTVPVRATRWTSKMLVLRFGASGGGFYFTTWDTEGYRTRRSRPACRAVGTTARGVVPGRPPGMPAENDQRVGNSLPL